MAKISWGILDGFIGKVGTVIGSFWKGKPVMRAYKRQVADRDSEAQQLVRTRFGAISSLSGAFLSAIRLGLVEIARRTRTTEGNVFVQENWGCVHADTPGTATVDYSELQIAKGNLPEAQFGTLSFATPLTITIPMTDTSEVIGADKHDLVYVIAYSPEAGAMVMNEGATRDEESIELLVPAYWNGHRVHVYAFAIGGGEDNQGVISNSRYLGSGTIA